MRRFNKILIIKPSSLGDIIHSLPFLSSIRRCFPEASIHWVVSKEYEELLRDHPMIQRVWVINKASWKKVTRFFKTVKEILSLTKELRNERFDLVVDLQGLLRSGVIAFFTRCSLRIGFDEAREGSRYLYTERIKGGRDEHAVLRYLSIAQYLGCDIKTIEFPLPDDGTKPFDFDYALLVPSARWKTKVWSPRRFGELASLLDIRSVVIGSSSDIPIAEEVVRYSHGRAISLAGRTGIKKLITLIRYAKFMVSNDSGPLHIASALGIPVFAIFGPTSPERTGPFWNKSVIIRAGVDCSPCFKKKCSSMRCMEMISVSDVYKKIKDYFIDK